MCDINIYIYVCEYKLQQQKKKEEVLIKKAQIAYVCY